MSEERILTNRTAKVTITPSAGTAVEISVTVKGVEVPTSAASLVFDATSQSYENAQEVTTVTATGAVASIVFDKGTNTNSPKYYTGGAAIRAYGGNTITITAADNKKIVAVRITFGSSDGSNEITSSTGKYKNGVYNGDSNSVVFTIGGTSGNRRIAKIEVWVEA